MMDTGRFLNSKEREIIRQYKNILMDQFPSNVQNFYLFGSKARGDFHDTSDIDILITLKNYDWKLGDRIRRIGYELDEEIDYKFSIMILPDTEFESLKKKNYQFIVNVLKDGVLI